MNGIDNQKQSAIKIDEIASPKQLYIAPCCRDSGEAGRSRGSKRVKRIMRIYRNKIKKTFDRYVDKIKDFITQNRASAEINDNVINIKTK
jgi:cell division protein FtsA